MPTEKVTAGPWIWLEHPSASMFGHPSIEAKNKHIADVGNAEDTEAATIEWANNAELIVTAVNACFSINPQDPLAVAREIVTMRDFISGLAKADLDAMAADAVTVAMVYQKEARNLLSRIEGKVK